MGNPGMIIPWLVEAITNLPASLLDPKYGGPIFALFVLVVLYSIVSSLNRLKRNIASVSSELSAIRSILKKIEWSSDRREGNHTPGAKEDKAIRDFIFRLDNDRSGKDR
jgi:hypothetical protein